MSTNDDNRLTWDLIIDVLGVLEKHGYHRGDDQHAGRAGELIALLARMYEGIEEDPGGGYLSSSPSHQAPSDQPNQPAGRDAVVVGARDRRTILAALDEAADLKRDRAANCSDCADQSCGTCEFRLKSARPYERVTAGLIGAEQAITPQALDRHPAEGGPSRRGVHCQAPPEVEAGR